MSAPCILIALATAIVAIGGGIAAFVIHMESRCGLCGEPMQDDPE